MSSKIGQLWTDSVAYVALLAGAGLSIAGNVANVIRTRGVDMDGLDVVLAVAFPGLVILMVEVFVSARWRGLPAGMQWLRWIGCISIGAVAMRVSWVHLNELMTARGQKGDVATFGPLAIDALAIMATALILAGRGQARPVGRMVFDHLAPIGPMPAVSIVSRYVATESDVAASEAAFRGEFTVADEATHYLERLAGTLDNSTTAAHPVSPAPMTNTVKPESVPEDARQALLAWALAEPAERPSAKDRNEILAAEHGVSTRTVRRWATALDGALAE
jgi:hypothetical protein